MLGSGRWFHFLPHDVRRRTASCPESAAHCQWHNMDMETHVTQPVSQEHLAAAEEELRRFLTAQGIDVRIIESAEAAAEASLLLDEVWSVTGSGTQTVLKPSLFIALAHAKNYTAAAYDRSSGGSCSA